MNIKSGNNTRLAVCITILIVTCTLILDRLIPEGIFLDGVTYAAISRNLAIGKGGFWSLYYRGDWGFHEHPPLMFGIQAIFFKIFGDHYLTEKIFCFAIWLATSYIFLRLWSSLKNTAKYSFALPLLLWCIIPTVTWGYTNNILDCTMAMFDMAAVLLIYRGLQEKSSAKSMLKIGCGGLMTAAAILTKGPVGAFPLAVPGIFWLVYHVHSHKDFFKAIGNIVLLIIIVAGCFLLLYQFPAPRANFDRYLDEQVLSALGGNREITGGSLGRFALVYDLLMQMLPPIVLAIVIFIIAKIAKVVPVQVNSHKKSAVFFLLIGLCASLPILLSVKQRTFYLVPSLPYFVFALSLVVYPYYTGITEKWQAGNKSMKYFRMVAVIISAGLCVYLGSKIGHPGRDHQLISNIKYISTRFPKGQVLGICPESDKDYAFLAYLQRYNQMEVNPVFYSTDYVLIDKNVCNNNILSIISKIGFKQQEFGLEQYTLYKKAFPLKFDFTLLNPVYRKEDK